MPGISYAVGIARGVQARNEPVDQEVVMGLLEKIPVVQGGAHAPEGTVWPSPQRGICSPFLHECILRVQRTNGLSADGRVDPGGPTIELLNRLAGMGSAQPAAKKDQIPPHFFPKIVELYQALNTILASPKLDRLAPEVRPKLANALKQLEADVVAHGGPKNPATRLNASFAIAIDFALAILVALIVAGVAWSIIVMVTIREIMKYLLRVLHKWAIAQLEEIKAKALALAVTTTCDPKYKAFQTATNNFIDALSYGATSKGVLGPLARAWLSALSALRACLGVKGLVLLTMLYSAQALVDLLDYILGTKWLSF